jgi:hypothetical protein
LVAPEAERTQVAEIALPSPLDYRQDMIGIPEAVPAAGHVESLSQLVFLARRQALEAA